MEVWEALKYKDLQNEVYLEEIEGRKAKYYNEKKDIRIVKEDIVKKKQMEDEIEREKRRRIMQLVEDE